ASNSPLQFQINLGRISGSVNWDTQSVSIGAYGGNQAGEYIVKVEGSTSGYSQTINLLGSHSYDTGNSLPADTYTVTVYEAGLNNNNSFVVGTQTVTVGTGQSVTTNFDISQTTGLVSGTLLVNGSPSTGIVQFCPPAPASCPTPATDDSNGFWAD